MKKFFLLTLMLVACTLMQAQGLSLNLPRFFADGMVLQRDAKIPVWGQGLAGSQVIVTLNGKTGKTTVLPDGTWKVYLPKTTNAGARLMITNDQSTGIVNLQTDEKEVIDKWYSLDGRRLNGKPTKKGLYIKNGQKAVVK